MIHGEIADVFLDTKQLAAALTEYQQSLAIAEKIFDPKDPELSGYLVPIGELWLKRSDPRRALPIFERALSKYDAQRMNTPNSEKARFLVARALWETNGDRARARSLAKQALANLQSNPSATPRELNEVRDWLADHTK